MIEIVIFSISVWKKILCEEKFNHFLPFNVRIIEKRSRSSVCQLSVTRFAFSLWFSQAKWFFPYSGLFFVFFFDISLWGQFPNSFQREWPKFLFDLLTTCRYRHRNETILRDRSIWKIAVASDLVKRDSLKIVWKFVDDKFSLRSFPRSKDDRSSRFSFDRFAKLVLLLECRSTDSNQDRKSKHDLHRSNWCLIRRRASSK